MLFLYTCDCEDLTEDFICTGICYGDLFARLYFICIRCDVKLTQKTQCLILQKAFALCLDSRLWGSHWYLRDAFFKSFAEAYKYSDCGPKQSEVTCVGIFPFLHLA